MWVWKQIFQYPVKSSETEAMVTVILGESVKTGQLRWVQIHYPKDGHNKCFGVQPLGLVLQQQIADTDLGVENMMCP